jgi:CRISPR/Cas system-associated endonuclease Cas1
MMILQMVLGSHYSPCRAQVDRCSVMCLQIVSRIQVSSLLISIMIPYNLPVFLIGQQNSYNIVGATFKEHRYVTYHHLREELSLLGGDPQIYLP